jgi:hypothetical protein
MADSDKHPSLLRYGYYNGCKNDLVQAPVPGLS